MEWEPGARREAGPQLGPDPTTIRQDGDPALQRGGPDLPGGRPDEARQQLPDYLRHAQARTAETDQVPLDELRQRAAPLLVSEDPLRDIGQAFRALGYGGQMRSAMIVELAVTSRLLAMRPGAMPVHLLLLGPPSAGSRTPWAQCSACIRSRRTT